MNLTEQLRASCALEFDVHALQSMIDAADWDARARYLIACERGADWRIAALAHVVTNNRDGNDV